MEIVKDVYRATAAFPPDERFGLTNQMRRAAVSVPSNLAEGHARFSTSEFQRFILIAMGSVAELETQVILSDELGHLKQGSEQGSTRPSRRTRQDAASPAPLARESQTPAPTPSL
jgi:four helix bundle protein